MNVVSDVLAHRIVFYNVMGHVWTLEPCSTSETRTREWRNLKQTKITLATPSMVYLVPGPFENEDGWEKMRPGLVHPTTRYKYKGSGS